MAYIRVDKDLPEDARVTECANRIAERFPIAGLSQEQNRNAWRNAVLGILVTLWRYADTHVLRDNSVTCNAATLANVVNVPLDILEMLPTIWLVIREDGHVVFPGYCEKNGIMGKDLRRDEANRKREQNRDRQRRFRQTHRAQKRRKRVTQKPSRDRNATEYSVTHTPVPVPKTIPVPGAEVLHRAPSGGALAGVQDTPRAVNGPDPHPDPPTPTRAHRSAPKPVKAKPHKSPEQLRQDALTLASSGSDADMIHRCLAQYGATLEDVHTWLREGGATPSPPS